MKAHLLVELRRCRTMTAPPVVALWPSKYFVVLCTETFAPSSSGRWKYGVRNVLSTACTMPRSRVIFEIAAMSRELQRRVGRRLGEHQLRVVAHGLADRLRVRRVDERELDAEARVDLRREPIRAAVRDVGDDRVIAGRQASPGTRPARRPCPWNSTCSPRRSRARAIFCSSARDRGVAAARVRGSPSTGIGRPTPARTSSTDRWASGWRRSWDRASRRHELAWS